MQFEKTRDGFTLAIGSHTILSHSPENPAFFAGFGKERMDMYRGNFDIEDYVIERTALRHAEVSGDSVTLSSAPGQAARLHLALDGNAIRVTALDETINRLWLRIIADEDEHVWGGGEQMSYFDMRGRRFPLWTSEPGVGRDKTAEITFKADVSGKAGGDYYNTNYPQPTYLSSRKYALHVETSAYSVFDFRNEDFHEVEIWAIPERIEFFTGDRFTDIVSALSLRFGRQPELPEWVYGGAIIGLKDGANSFARLEKSALPEPRSPACGARTGWGFARHHSAPGSSGTGRPMRRVIRICVRRSRSLPIRAFVFWDT